MTDYFRTEAGLKQGCLLSPILFSLYINDLPENIGGGVRILGTRIPCLMYADDIVLMSESRAALQEMIDKLEVYCSTWRLKINLNKSKIIVFRNGGKAARNDRWRLGSETIEVVNEYKYLGIILTPKLSLAKHFEEKGRVAKYGINAIWNRFLLKNEIPISAKMQIFDAVTRATLCYGAQVWGWKEYDAVERIHRFFLKRLLGLPTYTPNYALYLETRRHSLYLQTLRTHLLYVHKVLGLPDHRLPGRLMREVMRRRQQLYKDWEEVFLRAGESVAGFVTGDEEMRWAAIHRVLAALKKLEEESRLECLLASQSHLLYKSLSFQEGALSYIDDSRKLHSIRLIMKARTEMLNLNKKLWRGEEQSRCSMCNLDQDEDTLHFIAVCPVLKEFRLRWFGKAHFNREETVKLLNGRDWDKLSQYLQATYKYRQFLILEYNY